MTYYVRRSRFEVCTAAEGPRGYYRPQRCPHHPRCELTPAGFGRDHAGWTGPIASLSQAAREDAAWRSAGWTAEVCPSTPALRAEVRAWERENRQRRTQ